MTFKRGIILTFALLFSSILYAAPVKITNIRVGTTSAYQIVLDMSGPATFDQFTLKNPNRLVIDIKNAVKAFTPSQSIYRGFPVGNLRFATKKGNDFRLVYDLNTPCRVNASSLKPSGSRGYRILLKLTPTQHNPNLLTLRNTTAAAATTKEKIQPTIEQNYQPSQTKAKKLRDIVVVLDPGHGGKDPGATGPQHTHEKVITLAIGLKVRRDLQKIPGIKVYMTRTRDVYPTLGQRLALARRVKADLFISIHADAFKRRSARGATVFALSRGRATSEAARWIAERENKSELLGGVDLADKGYMLRSVLVDLSQTATIGLSLKLGKDVASGLSRITKMHSSRVEQASLYVLTSPDIPAILVETGFISNPYEERLLRSSSHQTKIALAVSNGGKRYLIENPIQNTVFTARTFGGKYIVKAGNTISGLAAKFKVSIAKLKQVNDFKSNKLFAGQVVRIPAK